VENSEQGAGLLAAPSTHSAIHPSTPLNRHSSPENETATETEESPFAIPAEVRPYLKLDPAQRLAERSAALAALAGSAPLPRAAEPAPKVAGGLFRTVWRWHFYAGVFVTPFLMTLAITGGLYIFQSEIASFSRSKLMYVAPQETRVSYQTQLDAAVAAHPGSRVQSVSVRPEPNRATIVTLTPAPPPAPPEGTAHPATETRGGGRGRSQITAYVDPYSGNVLGSIGPGEDRLAPFFSLVLSIHRNLFIGAMGRVITEVVTGWTIVLLVTGTYLWWPRVRSKIAGVWTMRLKAKKYTVLRDLHSVAGAYLMPIALVIAVTGLFYTQIQGKIIHDAAHAIMEDPETPAVAAGNGARGSAERGGGRGRQSGSSQEAAPPPPGISLDEIVAAVRREYPERIVFATLGGRFAGDPKTIRASAGNDFNNTYGAFVSTNMTLDRQSGKVLKQEHLSDGGHFWHGWTYPLHVGSIYGPTTKVIWFLACVVLAALPVTGLWMWWQRRPKGASGLPRRPAVPLTWMVISVIGVLCLLMPMLAASVVLILVGEVAFIRVRRRFARRAAAA